MNATRQLLSQRLPPKGVLGSEGAKCRAQPWLEVLPSPSRGQDPLLGDREDAAGAGAAKVSLGSAPRPAQLQGSGGLGSARQIPAQEGPARWKGQAAAAPQPCVNAFAERAGLGREWGDLCLCKPTQGSEMPRALCRVFPGHSRATCRASALIQVSKGCWSECMKEQEFVSIGLSHQHRGLPLSSLRIPHSCWCV